MTAERPSLWVCLPTYNEKENLEKMIEALGAEFAQHDLDGHVLVIDDNSPDGTGQIADGIAGTHHWVDVLHRTAKEGLGKAYIAGFRRCLELGADLVMEMDCDFSHNPADVHRLVEAAGSADIAIGSRNVAGGGVENWPLIRRVISKGGSIYARSILGVKVRDLTGGFKCFNRYVLESMDLDMIEAQGYAFQVELSYRALQAGYDIAEVPIIFTDRVEGESKMSSGILFEAMLKVWKMRFSTPHPPVRDS